MVIVPEKVTTDMIEATRGICWTPETESEKVQLLWDRMILAAGAVITSDKNAVFALGKKAGREEVQEGIKELLNIKECFCSDCLDT